MRVETKFKMYDILQHKYESHKEDMLSLFEVMEIVVQECMGGIQVFYKLRPIVLMSLSRYETGKQKEIKWHITSGIRPGSRAGVGWTEFREDELVKADKKYLSILKQVSKEEV